MTEHSLFISQQAMRDIGADLTPRIPEHLEALPFVGLAMLAGAVAQAAAIFATRVQDPSYRGMLQLI